MYSPTTNILNSIQALKSKLRDDHQQLQFIRKQFALPPTHELPEQEASNSLDKQPKIQDKYRNKSVDKSLKVKIAELRKKHQKEILNLKSEFVHEKNDISTEYEEAIQEIKQKYENRIKQQEDYICLLEEQISSKREQSTEQNEDIQRKNIELEQKNQQISRYEHVINNLMQENALLLQIIEEKNQKENQNHKKLQNCIYESRDHRKNERPSLGNANPLRDKSRLKFSKVESRQSSFSRRSISNMDSQILTAHYRSICQIKPIQKIPIPNNLVKNKSLQIEVSDENIDMSNFTQQSKSKWDDDSILNEEMKLKTIKHFWTNNEGAPPIRQFR